KSANEKIGANPQLEFFSLLPGALRPVDYTTPCALNNFTTFLKSSEEKKLSGGCGRDRTSDLVIISDAFYH
ncbi:MAG: hypothetical protein UU67_C0069G0001, partial [Candidatus Daviesbacteria bacterium GW2011_GWB1_41_5]